MSRINQFGFARKKEKKIYNWFIFGINKISNEKLFLSLKHFHVFLIRQAIRSGNNFTRLHNCDWNSYENEWQHANAVLVLGKSNSKQTYRDKCCISVAQHNFKLIDSIKSITNKKDILNRILSNKCDLKFMIKRFSSSLVFCMCVSVCVWFSFNWVLLFWNFQVEIFFLLNWILFINYSFLFLLFLKSK